MKADERKYVELQVTTNYSFLRGASHPEELVAQAAALGYEALAITDRHSLAGIVKAHETAKQHGISLITGAAIPLYCSLPRIKEIPKDIEDIIETQPSELDELLLPVELLLYPASRAAYGRLCRLLSKGKLRSPKGFCFLLPEDLHGEAQGLIACAVVRNFSHPALLPLLESLRSEFDCDRLSLCLTRTYGPDNTDRLNAVSRLGSLFDIPLAAVNDVHYHIPERRLLHDVVTCIRLGLTLEQAGLRLYQNAERFLKPPSEMVRLFAAYPQAVRRTVEIAAMAKGFSLDQLHYEYPDEIFPAGKTPFQYLEEITWQGADERYPQGLPEKVCEQIRHELNLIAELHYEKYFLTVYDIVQFAKQQQILCQGRGAAANSAVCYVLGITAVDPGRINLLFERFISRERNEPPDIDIDFEHERREEVIQYIYAKYGRHRAALTASLITYRTRSAVRDAGKVFGLPEETAAAVSKLLTRHEEGPLRPGHLAARGLSGEDQRVLWTIETAQSLLGFPRHLSQHVGGFIISQQPLNEIVPIENAAMPDRTVIEWDKDDIECMGMLKIDLLGLGMLTAIRKCFSLINSSRPEQPKLELHNIAPEDPSVYDMICRADTIGVFQIESRAQMSMLPRLKPRCYYDLVIEVAIIRPGPIQGGMIHPYLRRRNGQEPVSYPDARIADILAPTLGVPIFQEQVMQLAVVAAGFTPGEADQLRRAMTGWKSRSNLVAKFEQRLIEGMRRGGYPSRFAKQIFDQIKGFGEYGFPQSHSASFALLVYVSAWLKRYHPAAFAAAMINSQPMGFYPPAQLVQDAERHNVEVREPDVCFSAWDCTLEGPAPALRLGLRLVKGLEQEQARRIAESRSRGPLRSVADIFRKSGASVRSMKLLAKADAFRSLGLDRQQALWQAARLRDDSLPLFEHCSTAEEPALLPPLSTRRQVLTDYDTLGLSLKAHPLAILRRSLARRGIVTAQDLRDNRELTHNMRTAVSGLVLVRQRPPTARGVAFLTLEDETGISSIVIKPKIFSAYRDTICDGLVLLAVGRLQRFEGITNLLAEELIDISSMLSEELNTKPRDFQ